MGFGVTPEVRM